MTSVSAEARGKRRRWLAQRTADYEAATGILFTVQHRRALDDFMHKAAKGRRRIFDRLHRQLARHGARLEALRLDGRSPVAIWAMLKPRPPLTYNPTRPGDAQDCVTLNFLHFGWSPEDPGGVVQEGLWTLEVTVHALGRFFERGDGAPDAAILALHHGLLNVARGEINLPDGEFKLRVDDDVWIGTPRPAYNPLQDCYSLHILTRTVLDFDQLAPEQERGIIRPRPEAGDDRLGEWWLAPPTFRRFVQDNGQFTPERHRERPQLLALSTSSTRCRSNKQQEEGAA